MVKLKLELLISIFVALFLISLSFASSNSPFLVVHKKVSLTRLKSGADRVLVSIDIYNQGSATAYDVSLLDDNWAQDVFDLNSGNVSKTWEKIDMGSIVSHSFLLESKVKGTFQSAPAVIKFRIPTKVALQEAFSNPILPLHILADQLPEKKVELAKRLLVKYGSLVSVISIVVLFISLVASPSKSSISKSGKKRR